MSEDGPSANYSLTALERYAMTSLRLLSYVPDSAACSFVCSFLARIETKIVSITQQRFDLEQLNLRRTSADVLDMNDIAIYFQLEIVAMQESIDISDEFRSHISATVQPRTTIFHSFIQHNLAHKYGGHNVNTYFR